MKKIFGIIVLAFISIFALTSCEGTIITGETTITDMTIEYPELPTVVDCGTNGTMTVNEFKIGKIIYKSGVGYILSFTLKADVSGKYFKITLAHYDEEGNELGSEKYEYLAYKNTITYIDCLPIERKTKSIKFLPNLD